MIKTKKPPKGTNTDENLLFLNLPISTETEDVIGLGSYAESLSDAIDSGAQMVAITSPFGSGKTSVIELLQEKRSNELNEKILKIPMWSHLNSDKSKVSSTELHRTLIYQIASQIDHIKGTYISRRLSSNYGLLKFHANKTIYFILSIIALLGIVFLWCDKNYGDVIKSLFEDYDDFSGGIKPILIILLFIICVIILYCAEIIFSSKNSEKERTIEPDEIIDVYKTEILKHYNKIQQVLMKCKKINFKGCRYIITIEDLDRIDDGKVVIDFLKELRKYYIPTNSKNINNFKNSVVFIVTIKPEATLFDDYNLLRDDNKNTLYSKIFDYVISLPVINIDDYDTVLEGLLESKRQTLTSLIPEVFSETEKFTNITGINWILFGKKIGIRELKIRLNKTFLVYNTLKKRFPESIISFEKCAVFAYLSTEFEDDFSNTPDSAFMKLVDRFISDGAVSKRICCEELLSKNAEYVEIIKRLVEAKLIDESYHLYFYNYPKGSEIYSYDELIVRKALFYGENSKDLSASIAAIEKNNSPVIKQSLEKIKLLGINLPEVVFENEKVYTQVLKLEPDLVISWLNCLDYTDSEIDKTIKIIIKVLSYDKKRIIYNKDIAFEFCKIWESKFKENTLLKLRTKLCTCFPKEIIWYKSLFFGVHSLITSREIKCISLFDAIDLVNLKNSSFSVSQVEHIMSVFVENNILQKGIELNNKIQVFLFESSKILGYYAMAISYLDYMIKTKSCLEPYEDIIINALKSNEVSEQRKNIISRKYQELINIVAYTDLSSQAIKWIYNNNYLEDFDDCVEKKLYEKKYILLSILISLSKNKFIEFNNDQIKTAIELEKRWLLRKPKYVYLIRKEILKNSVNIIYKYSFMFEEAFPEITENEFSYLINLMKKDTKLIERIIPANSIDTKKADMLCNYLEEANYTTDTIVDMLKYISYTKTNISMKFFQDVINKGILKYYSLSLKKRNEIKNSYFNAFKLGTIKGKLNFISLTKTLDPDWDLVMSEELNNDMDLQKQYVAILDCCYMSTITEKTLSLLCSFDQIYPMNEGILKLLKRNHHYDYYIISKTEKEKRFVFENDETLWPFYVTIFRKQDTLTAKLMGENTVFLNEIIKRKSYSGMSAKARMCLKNTLQDADSLSDVLYYGEDFACSYYSEMEGFVNIEAEERFIQILNNNKKLLNSNSVYKNVHPKLTIAILKRKYTRLKNIESA